MRVLMGVRVCMGVCVGVGVCVCVLSTQPYSVVLAELLVCSPGWLLPRGLKPFFRLNDSLTNICMQHTHTITRAVRARVFV